MRRRLGTVLYEDETNSTIPLQIYMCESDMQFLRAWGQNKRMSMSQLCRTWLVERMSMEKAKSLFEAGNQIQGK